MDINFYNWNDTAAETKARIMRRSGADIDDVIAAVTPIIADVKLRGDDALRDYAQKFDGATLDNIVLPGQGAFADCMSGLRASGMIDALEENVLRRKKPFLGICVGMQLLADRGLEHGAHDGLGWIGGEVVPLTPDDPALKIPHMGWNVLEVTRAHPVLDGVETGAHYYFVHSFMFKCAEEQHCIARAQYGGDVTAMIAKDNIIGVQFHPEKSQENGMALLRNFLRL